MLHILLHINTEYTYFGMRGGTDKQQVTGLYYYSNILIETSLKSLTPLLTRNYNVLIFLCPQIASFSDKWNTALWQYCETTFGCHVNTHPCLWVAYLKGYKSMNNESIIEALFYCSLSQTDWYRVLYFSVIFRFSIVGHMMWFICYLYNGLL